MFDNLGTIEVLVVSLVLLGLFGSKRLKEVAKGLGESKREIEKVKGEIEEEVRKDG